MAYEQPNSTGIGAIVNTLMGVNEKQQEQRKKEMLQKALLGAPTVVPGVDTQGPATTNLGGGGSINWDTTTRKGHGVQNQGGILQGLDPAMAAYVAESPKLMDTIAQGYIGQQFATPEEDDLATDQKLYRQAVAQGYKGTLMDFLREKANFRPAASTTVEVSNAPILSTGNQSDPWGTVDLDMFKEDLKSTTAQVAKDNQTLSVLSQAEELIAGGTPTGTVANLSTPLRGLLASFGINDPNLPAQQALLSLENQLALNQHKPGMGPMTDSDFSRYAAIGPRLGTTREGNVMIIQRLRHEIAGREAYRQALRKQSQSRTYDPRAAWAEAQKEVGSMFPQMTMEEAMNYTGPPMWVVIDGRTAYIEG